MLDNSTNMPKRAGAERAMAKPRSKKAAKKRETEPSAEETKTETKPSAKEAKTGPSTKKTCESAPALELYTVPVPKTCRVGSSRPETYIDECLSEMVGRLTEKEAKLLVRFFEALQSFLLAPSAQDLNRQSSPLPP